MAYSGEGVMINGQVEGQPVETAKTVAVDSNGHLIVTSASGGSVDMNLVSVSGVAITEGQKTMAASLPVVIASDQSTLAVSNNGTDGAFTDGSTTITLGGTSQQIFAANATRKYLIIQNISDTDMNVNFGSAATTSTMLLPSMGSSFVMEANFISNQTVNIICATTGKAFVAKQG